MPEWLLTLLTLFVTAVTSIGGVLLGFVLGLFGTQFNDWWRARRRRREIATAIVYELRKAVKNLSELEQAMEKTKTVIYTSDFTQHLFEQTQSDLAQLGGQVYMLTSAFYAQLRNVNFLRAEAKQLGDKVELLRGPVALTEESMLTAIKHNEACETLLRTIKTGKEYGEDALEALKLFADGSAYKTQLPEIHYTPHELEALGRATNSNE